MSAEIFQVGDRVELSPRGVKAGLGTVNKKHGGVVTDTGKRTIWVRRDGWPKAGCYPAEYWQHAREVKQAEFAEMPGELPRNAGVK